MPPAIDTPIEVNDAPIEPPDDPRLLAIAERVIRTGRLAAEKAVANFTAPAEYPLPDDPTSFERVVSSHLHLLAPVQQRRAVERMLPQTTAAREIRARLYKELSTLDLRSREPIAMQKRRLVFPTELKLSAAELRRRFGLGSIPRVLSGTAPPPRRYQTLRLSITRVRCIDQTLGFWEFIDDDDMFAGGVQIDEYGNVAPIRARELGSFRDGTVRAYSSLQLAGFNLRGDGWPKNCIALWTIAETDAPGQSHFREYLDALTAAARREVLRELEDAASADAELAEALRIGGAVLGKILGAVLSGIIGWVVETLFGWLSGLFDDEFFRLRTSRVRVRGPQFRFAEGRTHNDNTLTFRQYDGHYQVTRRWRLTDPVRATG